jgi:AraC family transcriptional regulator
MLHRNNHYVSHSESFSIEFENEWCSTFETGNQQNCPQHIIVNPLVKMKMIAVMKEANQPDAHSNLCLEATVLDILHSLSADPTENVRPPWITSLYELLHDEDNTHWTLTSLSQTLNVHPVTISKVFPRFFKTTIGDYIRKIKTEKSLGDLARKSIPLEEIALKHGFADHAHFTRVFKKNTGLTPSAYRRVVTG